MSVAYATIDELAQVATDSWDELAQLISDNRDVTGDLLRARFNAESLSENPSLIAALDEALNALQEQLLSVSRYADTYLNQHYRELIPLASEHYQNTGLPFAVAAIALGRLYGLRKSDDMHKTLTEQENYLRDLAAGKASLNYQQPSSRCPWV